MSVYLDVPQEKGLSWRKGGELGTPRGAEWQQRSKGGDQEGREGRAETPQ